MLSGSKVPACWKVAKLSPIHKKGEVLNPGNYRTIAVSGVMCCLFPRKRMMTLSLGNNSGHICVVVLCHLLCSAWSSICMRMMSTF